MLNFFRKLIGLHVPSHNSCRPSVHRHDADEEKPSTVPCPAGESVLCAPLQQTAAGTKCIRCGDYLAEFNKGGSFEHFADWAKGYWTFRAGRGDAIALQLTGAQWVFFRCGWDHAKMCRWIVAAPPQSPDKGITLSEEFGRTVHRLHQAGIRKGADDRPLRDEMKAWVVHPAPAHREFFVEIVEGTLRMFLDGRPSRLRGDCGNTIIVSDSDVHTSLGSAQIALDELIDAEVKRLRELQVRPPVSVKAMK